MNPDTATHRLLERQLQRQLKLASHEHLRALQAQLEAAAAREGGEVGAVLRGLPAFVEQVAKGYALYDRDLSLASRSLEISSDELLRANAQMREHNQMQQRTLGHLRDALRQLAASAGVAPAEDDDLGLEALSRRLSSLVRAQEQAQQALQASEAKFRALTELSSDWYWEQDSELRFVCTVGRDDDRGGLAPHLHIGKRRWELPNTEPVDVTWAEHQAVLQARRPFFGLLLRRRATDGTTAYVEVSGAPAYDDGGRFVGYHGVARNVSSRLQAQEALESAKAAADAANAAKSRFLATMSHELRTPMNGMLGMAELLLDDATTPTQLERLGVLQDSGRTLMAIIDDILDFSKIEAGHLLLESAPFDVAETIEQSLAVFEPLAQAKGIELRVGLDAPPSGALLGDALRLKQVLANLLSNAIKFTDRGAVALRAQLRPVNDIRLVLRLEVQDSGPGLDEQVAAQLFQPFRQADASTTRRYGGTGLGLAISKHLTQLMGGTIGVTSQPGHGATFWIDIPFARARPLETRRDLQVTVQATVASWRGRRVLLVEDNPTNMLVARVHLETMGLEVDTAVDGVEALHAMHAQRPELVLMDCQMPRLDGYAAVQRWREHEAASGQAQRLTVIALTADAMEEDRRRGRLAGFDDHLAKPFDRSDLRRLLQRWLHADAASGANASIP